MHRWLLCLLASAAVAASLAGCGGGGGSSAPRAVFTPRQQYIVRSVDDAILRASYVLSGHTDPNGIEASNVSSLVYVRTTVGAAERLVGQAAPGADANATAWLFLERGDFLHARPIGEPTPTAGHVLWVLAIEKAGISYGIGPDSLDISSLGTPTVIPPGRVPSVDERRAPAAADTPAAAGTPGAGTMR